MSAANERDARLDDLFRQAVDLIHIGDTAGLEQLLAEHTDLATSRLESPGPWLTEKIANALNSFFARPYLLWFVSEDAVLYGTLPSNIAEIATAIIHAAREANATNLQEQLEYALSLVAWSGVAAQCGVQVALLDVLVDAGANPAGVPNNALVNRHIRAAEHLVERGAPLTLATAFCLGHWNEAARLNKTATDSERRFAFVLAALNGRAEALRRMIAFGYDVNARSADLYSHGSPLHHAVCSGSLEAVQVLVDAGADVRDMDTAWQGTPLGWAEYYLSQSVESTRGKQYQEIAAYLKARTTS
jgi:hypothetical protein